MESGEAETQKAGMAARAVARWEHRTGVASGGLARRQVRRTCKGLGSRMERGEEVTGGMEAKAEPHERRREG